MGEDDEQQDEARHQEEPARAVEIDQEIGPVVHLGRASQVRVDELVQPLAHVPEQGRIWLGLGDQHATARGEPLPGAEIHAQLVENVFEPGTRLPYPCEELVLTERLGRNWFLSCRTVSESSAVVLRAKRTVLFWASAIAMASASVMMAPGRTREVVSCASRGMVPVASTKTATNVERALVIRTAAPRWG